MKKNIKVKVKNYKDLVNKNEDLFILSIQLARLSNALRTQMRILRKIIIDSENEDKMIMIKNRFDTTLLLAAVLYECIKTYKNEIEKKVPYNLLSEENKQKYQRYKVYYDSKKIDENDFQKLLQTLRDKVIFHFDRNVIKNTIKNINFNEEEYLLASGSTEQIKDFFFNIPDDVVLHYLTEKFPSFYLNKNTTEFFEKIENQIFGESFNLSNYFDSLIGEILKEHLYAVGDE